MSGCIESKDWDPGSNEGKEKTSLDFCRTGISPGWFLSPPAMWWFSCSRAPQAPLPCCPSLPSFQSQVLLSLWVPSIHPHTLSLAGHPQTLPPSCQLLEASRIKREQRGQQFPVPASATLYFAKQLQAIQSPGFSRESRRQNSCNVRNQHLGLGTSVPVMTFVNNSRGVCIWEI